MEIKKIVEGLHPLERKVLIVLRNGISLKEILMNAKLSEVEAMRALQWLNNKKIVLIIKKEKEIITLGNNGRLYLKENLPERKLLNVIKENISLKEAKEKSKLSDEEFNISLGLLKTRAIIKIEDNKINLVNGKFIKEDTIEEKFLKRLPLEKGKLNDEDRFAYSELRKRREIIEDKIEKNVIVNLTDLGNELIKVKIKDDFLDELSSKLLLSGDWKGKRFRRYDVTINVPKVYNGKRHFVNQAIEYIKSIWLEMGFKEMTGNLVQSSFWNFDALFVPQDHPARELQDTFFVKDSKSNLDKKFVARIKEVHEDGGKTGSKGWQYKWDEEEARRNVLRTHTTVLSAQTIAKLKESDLPAKYFAVGPCFRNETVDWKHSFEFYQTEGIVVGEVNFRHLLGYLKEFFKKMGFPKARFRPAFFPYVNCGLEIEVYHSIHKKWMELGGAGIFRPEVVIPLLGKNIPVLAWGLGPGRIIMDYYNINDLRDFNKNDIRQLKEMKMWLK